MISKQIQQLEDNIQQSKQSVELGASLGRLFGNRDFKKVILEGFFEQEAIRLVHLKADPNMQSYESQESILSQMNSIGALRQYFQLIEMRASMADKSITYDEQTRDDLLAEGI